MLPVLLAYSIAFFGVAPLFTPVCAATHATSTSVHASSSLCSIISTFSSGLCTFLRIKVGNTVHVLRFTQYYCLVMSRKRQYGRYLWDESSDVPVRSKHRFKTRRPPESESSDSSDSPEPYYSSEEESRSVPPLRERSPTPEVSDSDSSSSSSSNSEKGHCSDSNTSSEAEPDLVITFFCLIILFVWFC